MATIAERFLSSARRVRQGIFEAPRDSGYAIITKGGLWARGAASLFQAPTATVLKLERVGRDAFVNCLIQYSAIGSGPQGTGASPTRTIAPGGNEGSLWAGLITGAPGARSWGVGINGSLDSGANRLVELGEVEHRFRRPLVMHGSGDTITFGSTNARNTFAAHLLVAESTLSAETVFPVGIFLAVKSATNVNRQALVTVRLSDANGAEYTLDGTGTALSGGWRQRGRIAADTFLFQRVS